MTHTHISKTPLPDFSLWKKLKARQAVLSFDLEVTARCNNNCRHCYINLPATDTQAKATEISFEDIKTIADEAVSLGTLWCLITGGEPLLRDDFFDIYLYLKKRGLLVSVFTNATLVSNQHVRLFKKYPPRNIEISVYGATKETYERVTRTPGSFAAFNRGLELLLASGVRVRLKAMALRSNIDEWPQIASLCREKTYDAFRFDPFLHLRFDGNPIRNMEIKSERLGPAEIVSLEQSDKQRFFALQKICTPSIATGVPTASDSPILSCGAGLVSFSLSHDGLFSLCSALLHPDYVYTLKNGSLRDAVKNFVPQIRGMRIQADSFLEKCNICPVINLCMGCPAHIYLETGKLDTPVSYFCDVAHARAACFGYTENPVTKKVNGKESLPKLNE